MKVKRITEMQYNISAVDYGASCIHRSNAANHRRIPLKNWQWLIIAGIACSTVAYIFKLIYFLLFKELSTSKELSSMYKFCKLYAWLHGRILTLSNMDSNYHSPLSLIIFIMILSW